MKDLLAGLGCDPLPAAARALMESERRLIVATGFPVGGQPETDGPPGAIALCHALVALGAGSGVALASWRAVLDLCAPELPREVELLELPMPPHRCARLDGDVIAIEVCGTTPSGARLNMRGEDLRDEAPCFEDALGDDILVAIGDGGNEMGMGSAPAGWHERHGVERPRSRAEFLVPADVSNRGALALVAASSAHARRDLLPNAEAHVTLIARLVARGAVDGFTGDAHPGVDGRPSSEEGEVIAALRRWWVEQQR